jgi:hypothetical protein
MTRSFNQQFHCANCKTWQTAETLFGRWIRSNPDLDSRHGYSVTDQDYWIHRFKTFRGREFQLLMLVEIKTMGAELTDAQKDTLYTVNQVMRNRRQTPTKDLRHQAGSGPLQIRSAMLGRDVVMRAFGMHVLTFSGLGPDDSTWIRWDKALVTTEQLTSILRFDLDPDSLTPLDLRSHHQHIEPSLGLFAEKGAA